MAKKAFDFANRQQADLRQLNPKDQSKENTLGIWLGVFLVFIGAALFYFIHVEPTEPAFYYWRSEIYRKLGQEEEAQEEYRKATTLEYALLPTSEKQDVPVVNRPFQQKNQGITLMRICREVDRNSWLPIGEADSFSSDLERIYCLIHLARPMEDGEKITLEWYYDGVETVAAEIDDQPGYNVYDFYLTQKDWQERQGDWEALLYLSDASGYITNRTTFTITD